MTVDDYNGDDLDLDQDARRVRELVARTQVTGATQVAVVFFYYSIHLFSLHWWFHISGITPSTYAVLPLLFCKNANKEASTYKSVSAAFSTTSASGLSASSLGASANKINEGEAGKTGIIITVSISFVITSIYFTRHHFLTSGYT